MLLCRLGSLLFREEKDESACMQLSLGMMRERQTDRRKRDLPGDGGGAGGLGGWVGGDIFMSLVK